MKKVLFYLLLVLFAFAFLYPFIWMVSASLSDERSITSVTLWPIAPTLNHYIQLYGRICVGPPPF